MPSSGKCKALLSEFLHLSMAEKILFGCTIALVAAISVCLILPVYSAQPRLVIYPPKSSFNVPAGARFTLKCSGQDSEGHAFTNLKWIDPHGQVAPDVTPGKSASTGQYLRLNFVSPKVEESGTYKCTALYSNVQRLETEVKINFYGFEPKFEYQFENMTAEESSDIEVSCYATGDPSPRYIWYNKFDDEISSDRNSTIFSVSSGNSSSLHILGATKDDSGIYTCNARNEHGLASKLYEVLIVPDEKKGGEPKFENKFENVTAEEGSDIELFCYATGDPSPRYKWYNKFYDEITSHRNSTIFSVSSGNGSRLHILGATRNDRGIYTCNAFNEHGLASKLYEVLIATDEVDGNRTIDISKGIISIDVILVTERSVRFAIRTARNVRSVLARYTEKLNSSAEYVEWYKGDIYEVEGLIPSGLYFFQFLAQPNDNDSWSRTYEVVLLPGIPEVIFLNLNEGKLQVEFFRKVDDVMRGSIDKYEVSYYTVQMSRGNTWIESECVITTEIAACVGSKYTIAGLYRNSYYEIRLRTHTKAGFGKYYQNKVYIS